MHTACVWSEKLPFAEYSVVKELFGLRPKTSNQVFSLAVRSTAKKRSGEYRARTGDLLVANQALSQLS
jgi:hypothetical protein